MFFKKKPQIETIQTVATLTSADPTEPTQSKRVIVTPAPIADNVSALKREDIDTERSGQRLIKSVIDYIVKRETSETQFLEDLSKDLELQAALIEFDSLQTNKEVKKIHDNSDNCRRDYLGAYV